MGGRDHSAALVLAATLAVTNPSAVRAFAAGDPARGAELFAIASGCGCHTPKEGPIGAGGVTIETPFGTFYSTNITSDRENGIGAWSDDEIDHAIRRGRLRDGSAEAPVMPYDQYAGLADGDARDLIAYLRTLPAVERANRPHEVSLPWPRLAFAAWRWLFAGGARPPASAPADASHRGQYLTDHLAICGDCHTPRNRLGVRQGGLYLAGVAKGPRGELVPNITSDRETGIGGWDQEDVIALLESGFKPNFDNVQGLMAEIVDGVGGGPGLGRAPPGDLRAIASYIKSVPAVAHRVESGSGSEKKD